MSNLDIFNLDAEAFVTKTKKENSEGTEFYKPYPENGKDGIYKSLIRFLPITLTLQSQKFTSITFT